MVQLHRDAWLGNPHARGRCHDAKRGIHYRLHRLPFGLHYRVAGDLERLRVAAHSANERDQRNQWNYHRWRYGAGGC